MDKNKYGINLEKEFVEFLNGKKLNDFNDKWRKHLKRMFPHIHFWNTLKAYKYHDSYAKPDIVIECGKEVVRISLKTGHNPTMHCEKFFGFYRFLKDLGVSQDTLSILALYHFGESKKFGHHEKPLTKNEIVSIYKDRIIKANIELNSERIIKAIIKRSITKGAIETRESINYFYYGNLEKGFLMSVEDIYKTVLEDIRITSEFICFGALVYQPSCRKRDCNDYLLTTIHFPMLCLLYYKCTDENNVYKTAKKLITERNQADEHKNQRSL